MLSIVLDMEYLVVVPSSASLAEAHDLSRQLLRVAERARSDFTDLVAEFGMTPVQARAVLWLEKPSTMSSLAEHLTCDASNITGLADRLSEAGLVERVTGTDRRVKLLQLTSSGTRLRTGLAGRVARGSTVTAKLNATERRQLAILLGKLLA